MRNGRGASCSDYQVRYEGNKPADIMCAKHLEADC